MGKNCFLCGLCQGYITPISTITQAVFVERVFVTERYRLVAAEESYLLDFKE
jgi:hypothetical protein